METKNKSKYLTLTTIFQNLLSNPPLFYFECFNIWIFLKKKYKTTFLSVIVVLKYVSNFFLIDIKNKSHFLDLQDLEWEFFFFKFWWCWFVQFQQNHRQNVNKLHATETTNNWHRQNQCSLNFLNSQKEIMRVDDCVRFHFKYLNYQEIYWLIWLW